MKFIFIALTVVSLTTVACKSKTAAPTQVLLCDTTCFADTLRFDGDHALHPFLDVIPGNCHADSMVFGHDKSAIRKTNFDYPNVRVNKSKMRCIFSDTSWVNLQFNDCATGRGYQLKVYFAKGKNYTKRTSGINNLDPKFVVSNHLVAYMDRGNIFVEDAKSGKNAQMTLGEALPDLDYDAMHEYIDSVNITNDHIWAKVKLKSGWKELEKKDPFK